nr:transposase [Streptomyces sp. Wb2n-11]
MRARPVRKAEVAIRPSALVFDDTGFLKDGNSSGCVSRQYTRAPGEVTDCRVGFHCTWRPVMSRRRSTGGCSCPGPGTPPRRRRTWARLSAAPPAASPGPASSTSAVVDEPGSGCGSRPHPVRTGAGR